jgi:hypothetical protein
MSENQNIETVKTAYDSFKTGEIAKLLNTLATNITWTTPGPTEILPTAGIRLGRGAVAEFFQTLEANEEVINFEPKEFIAQGDKVVALGTYKWRIKSTNKTIEADWCHIFTVENGIVTNFVEFFDTALAVEAYRSDTAKAADA